MSTRRTEPAPLKHPPTGALARHWARVVRLACELPDVEESRSYNTPSIKTRGKLLGRLRSEAEGALALRCDFVDRQMLMQADPETFFVTDHYQDYPMVLIDLSKVRWDAMPGLLEAAWKAVATKTAVARYEASK